MDPKPPTPLGDKERRPEEVARSVNEEFQNILSRLSNEDKKRAQKLLGEYIGKKAQKYPNINKVASIQGLGHNGILSTMKVEMLDLPKNDGNGVDDSAERFLLGLKRIFHLENQS